jgi:hypothetical protein
VWVGVAQVLQEQVRVQEQEQVQVQVRDLLLAPVLREQRLSRIWHKERPERVSYCFDADNLSRVLIMFGLIVAKKSAQSRVLGKQSYERNWRLTKWHQANENE